MARVDLKLVGAAMERKAVLGRVRRVLRSYGHTDKCRIKMRMCKTCHSDLHRLVTWLLERHKRYEKAKGGLWRKRK